MLNLLKAFRKIRRQSRYTTEGNETIIVEPGWYLIRVQAWDESGVVVTTTQAVRHFDHGETVDLSYYLEGMGK